jgi:hypothetical protein
MCTPDKGEEAGAGGYEAWIQGGQRRKKGMHCTDAKNITHVCLNETAEQRTKVTKRRTKKGRVGVG